jgi:hypothetical protein
MSSLLLSLPRKSSDTAVEPLTKNNKYDLLFVFLFSTAAAEENIAFRTTFFHGAEPSDCGAVPRLLRQRQSIAVEHSLACKTRSTDLIGFYATAIAMTNHR